MSGGRNHGFARGVKRAGGAGALIAALVVSARLTSSSGLPDTPVWLGWFSLLPLFLALRLGSPVTAFWAGVLWGISLHLFSCAEPLVLSCSGLGALLLRALVPAGYAYLGCRLARALGFNPLVLGVGWMGVELALAPLGVQSAPLAGIMGRGTVLHWVADALGYVLAAFVVALVTASFVSLLVELRWSFPAARTRLRSTQCGLRLAPQTFFCVPFFALQPSRPRAPPPMS